ncbi:hypothetical protein HU200_003060 [Digitaria exilis]|uniref:Leucine-rich repeat-containing N-terminal plant-type domain-containing protein n=1 Tax=Digitaria exilis TaxID=1010633 RepID=A0A835FXD2_9POAL|nr:hypothetical protein HU200_003060 [Digitaria exilis]
MFRYHPLPSYLLLLIVILATSGHAACLCRQDQSAALLRLKGTFLYDISNFLWCEGRNLSSWKVDTNCCTWEGVTCEGTSGYVTALDLSDRCISGNLSSSEIFKLTSLRFLSLADNNFDASPWPSHGFEQLTDLEYLDLSYSGLSGALPVENGQLSNLVSLDLSGLDLKDLKLETLINNLANLQSLYLVQVNISVSPSDFAHASSPNTTSGLKELIMGHFMITGGRFDNVLTKLLFRCKLANLVTLSLFDLDLKSVSLYTLIESLGNLQNLYLDQVNISVSPTNLVHASSTNTTSGLKELVMGSSRFIGGRFDNVLTNLLFRCKLANLVTLDLWDLDPKIVSLNTLIESLGNLQNLYLGNINILTSTTDLVNASSTNTMSDLKQLSMHDCTISGGHFDSVFTHLFRSKLANLVVLELWGFDLKSLSLLDLIDSLRNLQTLNLGYVNILASTTDVADDSSINMMSGLKELSMRMCTITGRIDIALSKLRFLSKLTLYGTHFSGSAPVPKRFVEFSSLAVLSLQNCGLIWTTFPSWIFRIKSLISLDLSGNDNLCGVLPEFIQGSALQVLILRGTKFAGKIPESIGNLRNLTKLDLSNCQFHGLIPPFAQWPKIQEVDLSGNNLNGSLPSDGYFSLHNLTTVSFGSNSISGGIPASLFSHPSLKNLDLSQNNFTGKFRLYPDVSSSLRRIDVSSNKLHGPLPEMMSKFIEIEWLDLSSNNFTGVVDLSFIKNYNNLYHLSLSNNKLSVVDDVNHSYVGYPAIQDLGLASCNLSYVPKFLKRQMGINNLDLSNNNIGGHIPDWIWGVTAYGGLNLSHNLFTSVDTNLSNTTVFYLDLSFNKIEGALPLPPQWIYQLDYSNNHFNSYIKPEFWSRFSSANSLSLANNSLTGELSRLICSATDIEVLDLAFNSFSGSIPPCLLKDNKRLEVLNFRDNNFHGSLPQDISKECALQIIDLNGNKLEGKLPASLVNCHMLQVLDVGNNLIVDTYPEWLGVIPLLKVLVLKSNGFHGPIDYYGMNKLQVLDLSSNSFNSSIPPRFLKQFKAMMTVSSGAPSTYVGIIAPSASTSASALSPSYFPYYKESITVTLKGQETTLVQILSIFMYLDLSNNNFEGIIPNEIGDLKLLKQLNLSRNSFTRGIPPQIANILQLETLDLSFNHLSGEIPPEMAKMSFLEVLNLSYNNLSGMIPQSSQFLTFPNTSFLGNDGLCGKPLTRQCDTNQAPSAAATPDSSKELNWEFLSVEIGVVSGLVITFVTMLLWGNGKRWVYWHVDKFWLQVLQPWICHCLR